MQRNLLPNSQLAKERIRSSSGAKYGFWTLALIFVGHLALEHFVHNGGLLQIARTFANGFTAILLGATHQAQS
jgi:hypothetical protein